MFALFITLSVSICSFAFGRYVGTATTILALEKKRKILANRM